jgi:geranylgeranyl pyrophosphate synthase
MGALIGGASDDDVEHCRRAGRAAGIAFQLVDDLLDGSANAAQLGKPVGADAQNGKFTYPGLHGIPATQARILALTAEANEHLAACRGDTTFLRTLITRMASRDR